ncbi:hypothetical protein A2392_01740 [Candidatus Kaiserbacteria bacterium RIFOXYB1_FULL_46_14]|uniref:D-alanine--D-alanine ligase n=1 Tax=Candidatus Kaiserbacteria bacterium RIFOXYB1_FULL_46_14 TaxID=1798531 RepID=A0A1F6FJY5_9BACT|nr:MAG: hypothetical protein A2392_01740 [Candidatus Kaiserbacteria bacterium RIFOXYB1_FULL_46_14]
MKNLRVAVLRGGPSEEYEVSMKTGASVIEALQRLSIPYNDIVINRRGEWLLHGIERTPADALFASDVVFIALHGQYGEDGTVQRLLDRLGIPYVGSGAYSSALAMNKVLTKEILRDHKIKQPAHLRVTKAGTDVRRLVGTIETLFGPEYIVKPVSGGSSIDTHHAHNAVELNSILDDVLSRRDEVLVEEFVRGKEATVGIVENLRDEAFYSLPAVEIVPPPSHSFFASDVKYDGRTEEICPGRFSREEKEALSAAAILAHQVLGLSHYSRSDFIVNDKGVYFLETNTLPGLTQTSLLPQMLTAVGHSFDDFILHLLKLAVKK